MAQLPIESQRMHEDEAERLRAELEENRRQEEKLTRQLRAQVRVVQLRLVRARWQPRACPPGRCELCALAPLALGGGHTTKFLKVIPHASAFTWRQLAREEQQAENAKKQVQQHVQGPSALAAGGASPSADACREASIAAPSIAGRTQPQGEEAAAGKEAAAGGGAAGADEQQPPVAPSATLASEETEAEAVAAKPQAPDAAAAAPKATPSSPPLVADTVPLCPYLTRPAPQTSSLPQTPLNSN